MSYNCKPPDEYKLDTISCPPVYCPPDPLNPEFGDFNTTTCAYDKYITVDGQISWHFGCIEKNYCDIKLNCFNFDQNTTRLDEAQIGGESPDWGRRLVRYVSYVCDNDNIIYSSVRSLGGPDYVSSTNNLNPSSLIMYMLLALFFFKLWSKIY